MAVLVLFGDFEGPFARGAHDFHEPRDDGLAFSLCEKDGLHGNPRKHGDMRGGAEAVPFHKAQVKYGVLADGKGQDIGVDCADEGLAALL